MCLSCASDFTYSEVLYLVVLNVCNKLLYKICFLMRRSVQIESIITPLPLPLTNNSLEYGDTGRMSVPLKLNVVFQSRVGDGVECTTDKMLLHSADMKALRTKIGGFVIVEMSNTTGLFKAWPSKKAIPGTVTLHKMWQPNFTSDQRKIKASPITTNRLHLSLVTCGFSLLNIYHLIMQFGRGSLYDKL